MARRVRFALQDSPASTSSTLSSSPEPCTPQQLPQPLVQVWGASPPYAFSSPNYSPLSIPCDIHTILATPNFDFDTSLDPAMSPAMRGNLHLERILNEPATSPSVPSLTLVSRDLPWEIVISASACSYVAISDVLGGLYRALRIPASQQEYMREMPEKQNLISLAYYRRFERHVSDTKLREMEMQKGVKRIDFLAGAHRFRGLSKTERPNVWNIKFKQ